MTTSAFSPGTERWGRLAATLVVVAALGACATPPAAYDYTAFRQNRPVSMLVLPPVNETPEVTATYGVLSQVTLPLAEAGYYVVPVSLMDETFRQNGLNSPVEIHDVSPQKLRVRSLRRSLKPPRTRASNMQASRASGCFRTGITGFSMDLARRIIRETERGSAFAASALLLHGTSRL